MLRRLEIPDIDQCAAIHLQNSMEWSHNAQMGEDHLKNIYRVILSSPKSFGFGYFNESTLASFITATTDYFTTMDELYQLVSFKHYGKLLKQILKSPNELFDMLEAKFRIPRIIKKMDIEPHLLTWHNNFSQDNCSMAALAVMRKSLAHLNELGYDNATAQVDPNNPQPNRYYTAIKAPLVYSSHWNNIYKVPTLKRKPALKKESNDSLKPATP